MVTDWNGLKRREKRNPGINFWNISDQDFYVILVFIWNYPLEIDSKLLVSLLLQPKGVNLWYFKLWWFDLKECFNWNIKGLILPGGKVS